MLSQETERRRLAAGAPQRAAVALRARVGEHPGVVLTVVPEHRVAEEDGAGLRLEQAVVLVNSWLAPSTHALAFARGLGTPRVRAVHVSLDPEHADRLRMEWVGLGTGVPLEVLDAPFRSLEQPLSDLAREATATAGAMTAIVVPVLITGHAWSDLRHADREIYVKWLLLSEPRVVVTSVPWRLPRDPRSDGARERGLRRAAERG